MNIITIAGKMPYPGIYAINKQINVLKIVLMVDSLILLI